MLGRGRDPRPAPRPPGAAPLLAPLRPNAWRARSSRSSRSSRAARRPHCAARGSAQPLVCGDTASEVLLRASSAS